MSGNLEREANGGAIAPSEECNDADFSDRLAVLHEVCFFNEI